MDTSDIDGPTAQTRGHAGRRWPGMTLLSVGCACWLGAASTAASSPVTSTTPPAHPSPPTPVPDVGSPPEEAPAIILEDEPDEPVPTKKAEPPPAPSAAPDGPCSPTVELRFERGSSDLDNIAQLRDFARDAKKASREPIVIEGYASQKGSPSKNLKLSYRRARKVARMLEARGIPRRRIKVQAFGEYRPDLSGDERRDRRVVVRLGTAPSCPEHGEPNQ